MILVLDQCGDSALEAVGLDIAELLRHCDGRQYVVIELSEAGLELVIVKDAERAASLVLKMLAAGLPDKSLQMPEAVADIVRANAHPLH